MDKNEKRQLAINMSIATAVNSSISVSPLIFKAFKDVITTKQRPNKVAEVFNMCGDLLLVSIVHLLLKDSIIQTNAGPRCLTNGNVK